MIFSTVTTGFLLCILMGVTAPCQAQDSKEPAKIANTINSSDSNIALSGLDQETRKNILYYFDSPQARIDQIDSSLNSGYAKLLDDIEDGKFPCVTQKDTEKYASSEWSFRNLGFKNWVTSMTGYVLLQKANNLKYKIIIMKLLGDKTLKPAIAEKEKELANLLGQLVEMTKDEKWAE